MVSLNFRHLFLYNLCLNEIILGRSTIYNLVRAHKYADNSASETVVLNSGTLLRGTFHFSLRYLLSKLHARNRLFIHELLSPSFTLFMYPALHMSVTELHVFSRSIEIVVPLFCKFAAPSLPSLCVCYFVFPSFLYFLGAIVCRI